SLNDIVFDDRLPLLHQETSYDSTSRFSALYEFLRAGLKPSIRANFVETTAPLNVFALSPSLESRVLALSHSGSDSQSTTHLEFEEEAIRDTIWTVLGNAA